jgi:hypothetical protein
MTHGWCIEAGRGTGIPGLLGRHGGAQLQLLLAPDGEDQHRSDVPGRRPLGLGGGTRKGAEGIGWPTSRGWGAGERRGWVSGGEQHGVAATRLSSWAEWGTSERDARNGGDRDSSVLPC